LPWVPVLETAGPARPQLDFGADSAFCFFFPCPPHFFIFYYFGAATGRCTKASAPSTNKQLLLYDVLQKELGREKEKNHGNTLRVGFDPALSASRGASLTVAPPMCQYNSMVLVNYNV
jgi:hypothetical protein